MAIDGVAEGQAGASETISVSNVAVGFTTSLINVTQSSNPTKASSATVTVGAAPIRFAFDGSTPTASVGIYADVNETFQIDGVQNIINFKMIRATATDTSVYVTYSR